MLSIRRPYVLARFPPWHGDRQDEAELATGTLYLALTDGHVIDAVERSLQCGKSRSQDRHVIVFNASRIELPGFAP